MAEAGKRTQMQIDLITEITAVDAIRHDWNRLAGDNPFLHWEWLRPWWKNFAADQQLYVLAGRDSAGDVIGLAPWFKAKSDLLGQTIQFLGSGKACSDHLTLLCRDTDSEAFATSCADWLHSANDGTDPCRRWDYLEFLGVDQEDSSMHRLGNALTQIGYSVTPTPGQACFAIDLSDGWDSYFSQRSSSSKRQLRKLQATLDQPHVHVEVFTTPEALEANWLNFVELHQRRRCSMDDRGCFDHPGFDEFLKEATLELAGQQLARLYMVFAGDIPIGVSHTVSLGDTLFNYQSGMDPDYEQLQPGFLALLSVLNDMESNGFKHLDLMRGEEPYKERWRARRTSTVELRVPARRVRSIMLHHLLRTKAQIKQLLRSESLESELLP